MQFIDLKKQYQRIQDNVQARIHRVLEHGQYIMGPEVTELEHHLSEFVGVPHTIAVANGTDALLIAFMALGIKPGDEIITSTFSFIATAEMIALVGAKPVFVDIDPLTYNIDPSLIERAITPNTKAIMPVSLYGQCAEFDEISRIAEKHGLPVIEDAAQSFGATYKGKKSCALSTIACTSFFPSKPLGAYGDAGACFTSDAQLAKKIREIRNHGQDRRYHHSIIGLNSRMDTLQAAILLAKLDIFSEELELRTQVADRYNELLETVTTIPAVTPHNTSAYAQYTIEVTHRDAVQQHMQSCNIPTMVHYPVPIHLQPVFADLKLQKGSFPAAEKAAERVLSLPMHPYLTVEEQTNIVNALRQALNM